MEVIVFGKVKCGKCAAAKSRVERVIERMMLMDKVGMRFVDVDTIDGRAEGAFFDVTDAVPVILVMKGESDVCRRWEGEAPKSEELISCFEGESGAAAH
jgi:hypothetical protein